MKQTDKDKNKEGRYRQFAGCKPRLVAKTLRYKGSRVDDSEGVHSGCLLCSSGESGEEGEE